MPPNYSIQVLAEMVKAFDREQPRPGRETTAFIKRWRTKELSEKHSSESHLQVAIRLINPAEIQNIRETKKHRDWSRKPKKRGHYRKPSKNHGGARVKGEGTQPIEVQCSKVRVVDTPQRNVVW